MSMTQSVSLLDRGRADFSPKKMKRFCGQKKRIYVCTAMQSSPEKVFFYFFFGKTTFLRCSEPNAVSFIFKCAVENTKIDSPPKETVEIARHTPSTCSDQMDGLAGHGHLSTMSPEAPVITSKNVSLILGPYP